ncbi:hypothetical protein BO82DRAFT_356626 [Aspergillus uvarum CBS 121591]|uniref:Secreted protein CSS2 C-terminal domain-containing protein n=1 Tax=Aspergillus uvarum CBS 121591 TaxID=1448315 RepID=A0A319C5H7_9EURO|nr:hypothetical protein BO82DRAFT_356626 [Aspergillus uvarum CBS 121591]PYH79250.1 hypothetical protein BO82DRAFT_356626 [Aspergillus uvarum CBS 121591]
MTNSSTASDPVIARTKPSVETAKQSSPGFDTTSSTTREPETVSTSGSNKIFRTRGIFKRVLLFTTAVAVAWVAWAASHRGDCSLVSGEIDGWRYEYHAPGGNCDTSASRHIIESAIRHYVSKDENSNRACDTQCLLMDQGQSLEGHVKIGKAEVFNASAYCGPTWDLEGCGLKGVNSF